jgi:hypothetical protein
MLVLLDRLDIRSKMSGIYGNPLFRFSPLRRRAGGAAIIAPTANSECMNLHLQEITIQLAPGSIAGVVCDSAGWHQGVNSTCRTTSLCCPSRPTPSS